VVQSSQSGGRPLHVDQLVALNDEIAALVRAGVPLELGMREFGQSASRRLQEVSFRLSERMEAGASLERALAEEGDHLPGVYRAVVESGLRSGRLPDVLEELSGLARALQDLHRRVIGALVYPMVVAALAWGMTLALIAWCVPPFLAFWSDMNLASGSVIDGLAWLNQNLVWWSWGVPAALMVTWWISGLLAGSRVSPESGQLLASRLYRCVWVPGLIDNFDRAAFLRTFSLLVQHETPLHEAFALAGFATGNRTLVAASTRVGTALQAGEQLRDVLQSTPELPRFLRWMIATGERQQRLAETSRLAAEVYHERATRQADVLTSVAPALLTLVIGGLAVLAYGVLLLLPIGELYGQLGLPE